MDTVGAKGARIEIAAIKVVAARLATTVIDRAIQAFGAAGVSDDWPLASMYTHARTLHIVDGPDAVHLQQIARRELHGYESFRTAEVRQMKVRIGYGIGTQGLADGGARFAELIDALEALGFDSIWCSERATGPIPEPDGVARVRRRAHEAAEARHQRAGAARSQPGAARQAVGQSRRVVGRSRAPRLRTGRGRAARAAGVRRHPGGTRAAGSTRRCR